METRARDAASTAGLKELIFGWGALPNQSGPATSLIEAKVHVKGPRLVFWGNDRCESLYVACMGHENCIAKWRIVGADPTKSYNNTENTPPRNQMPIRSGQIRTKKTIAASSEAMVQTPCRRAEADPTETAAPAGAPPRNPARAGHEERAESEPTDTPGNPATPPTTGPRSPTDLAIDSWVQCDTCATWRLVPEGTMREFSGDRVFKCAYAAFVCKAKRPRAR